MVCINRRFTPATAFEYDDFGLRIEPSSLPTEYYGG